jgi:spore coat-associated protein N
MIRKALASILVMALMGGVIAFGSNAVFTDTATVAANTFTTGTIDISTSPSSAVVTFSAMAPGDSITQPLVVSNAGTMALRYSIAATATNADSKGLKDQLALTVKTVDVTTPGTPCDNFDGTQLYTGDLDGTTGALVGSSAQGAQGGDRSMAASSSETLCVRVDLPLSTGNGLQGATTTATFTFDAEQTANNP